MAAKEQRIIRFVEGKDEEGRTVLRPLTELDRKSMEPALRNRKDLRFGQTLEETQSCPIDSESGIPFPLTLCGIEAETEDDKKTRKRLARELWIIGDKTAAEELLTESLEES